MGQYAVTYSIEDTKVMEVIFCSSKGFHDTVLIVGEYGRVVCVGGK